jgi:two-component system phosphate regulon sensor histidine kinase PhoR
MLWWIAAAALLLGLAAWLFRRQWIHPWQELERLVAQIARREQPRTFLVSGNRYAWRIGASLEELLIREQELDRRLLQGSAEMNGVFGALTDALLVLDQQQRVQFYNRAFEQLFAADKVARGTPLLEVVRDADSTEIIRAALEEGDASRAREVSRAGKTFQLAAVSIKDKQEQISGAVVIFHDVSQLKQTDQIRRDFVANVSHELRTPLSIFRGNLETLLDEENLSREETRHIFSTMKRHSDRLTRLVEDLLTLTRLEAKETKLQLAPVKLAAFLRRVGNDWAKRLAQKSLRLEMKLPDNLPPLIADEFRLEQIMHNLLDNAVNYSPEGGMITISAAMHDRFVLSVADEGAGISPQDLPRIFERFYRADKSRSRELGSTGLGLSIVKHIAQLHGGDVSAESEPGKGTTIHVSLPAKL